MTALEEKKRTVKKIRKGHLERYKEYLKEDPDNTVILATIGELHHQSGDSKSAIRYFTKCLQLEPGNQAAQLFLAKVKISLKLYSEAEVILKELISLSPENTALQHELGLCFYYQARWNEAESAFISAGLEDNKNLTYFIYSLYHQKKISKSIQYAKKLLGKDLSLANNQQKGFFALQEIDNGNWVLGKRHANEVLLRDNQNVDALMALGLYSLHKHDIPSAIKYLSHIIKLQKTHDRSLLCLAFCALSMQDVSKAKQLLKQVTESNPNTLAVKYIWLGWIHLASDEINEAMSAFNKALTGNNKIEAAYLGKHLALNRESLYQEAQLILEEARKCDVNSVEITLIAALLQKQPYHCLSDAQLLSVLADKQHPLTSYLKNFVIQATCGWVHFDK